MRKRSLLQLILLSYLLLPSLRAAGVEPSAASKESQRSNCNPNRFKVVVDVGHTADAPGAISARGIGEFDFNLKLGREVAASLVRAGFITTKLLLSTGVGHPQLFTRVSRANSMVPDLLLSLHHDSVQKKYLSEWLVDGKALAFSDRFSGFSIFVASDNGFSKPSLQFAKLMSDALSARGLRYSLHHAESIPGEGRILLDAGRGIYGFNELVVLKHTQAPAVLLEAGVIVNRSEETIVASPEFREKISNSVVEAVNLFCATRQSGR